MTEKINNINTLLNDSNLNEVFIEKVMKRLESLQYNFENFDDKDAFLIAFAIEKVEKHIQTVTNSAEIASKLFPVAGERVCGEFLNSKSKSGQLTDTLIDVDAAVQSIKIGDTNITYATDDEATFEQKVNALIGYLIGYGEGDILCFRKIQW